MNPEQLLIPRYVVIASWPNAESEVGDVFTFVREVAQTYDQWEKQNGKLIYDPPFQKYPHLFKKLDWWEERQKNDLTGYIKLFLNGEWRVFHIDITDEGIMKWQFGGRRPEEFQPATEQEYNQYKRKTGAHD